jgi:hypothetical protein
VVGTHAHYAIKIIEPTTGEQWKYLVLSLLSSAFLDSVPSAFFANLALLQRAEATFVVFHPIASANGTSAVGSVVLSGAATCFGMQQNFAGV